jgi:hypothetical protein
MIILHRVLFVLLLASLAVGVFLPHMDTVLLGFGVIGAVYYAHFIREEKKIAEFNKELEEVLK